MGAMKSASLPCRNQPVGYKSPANCTLQRVTLKRDEDFFSCHYCHHLQIRYVKCTHASSVFNCPFHYFSLKGRYNLSFVFQPKTADITTQKEKTRRLRLQHLQLLHLLSIIIPAPKREYENEMKEAHFKI